MHNKKIASSVGALEANANEISNESVHPTFNTVNSEEVEDALLRISKIADFQVYYIDDPELEATVFKDGRGKLEFDLETGACSLYSPVAKVKQNIIKAADEIERREKRLDLVNVEERDRLVESRDSKLGFNNL